jgi:ribonuclease HI
MRRLDLFDGFLIKEKQTHTFNPFMEREPIEGHPVHKPLDYKPISKIPSILNMLLPPTTASATTSPQFTSPSSPSSLPLESIEEVYGNNRSVVDFFKKGASEHRPTSPPRILSTRVYEPAKLIAVNNPQKPVPFDQPRSKDGERLLYKFPNMPMVGPKNEYWVLVGSSDKSSSAWLMQFDGAANPNPGPASAGAVLWSPADANGKRSPVLEMGKFIGKNTNNVAEIQGLLLGLKMAAMRGARDLLIEGDSELIIFQQIGKYKVSHKNLKVWWSEIQAAMMDETCFDWIAIRHVRRELNERADSITKEVLSKKQSFTR